MSFYFTSNHFHWTLILFIYFWLGWGLVASRAFLEFWRAGATLVVVSKLLAAVSSLVSGHQLQGVWASLVAAQ